MQKKLLAAAVLSAFAGAASAQSANVTIYGTLQGDFQFASATGADTSLIPATSAGAGATTGNSFRTAASYTATPANQSTRSRSNPAGSNFGLRGNEDLGNGLSAWFQLELATTLGAPSGSPDGINHGNTATYRNTAVGLRSNTWGTVSVGMWDTPFNVVVYDTANANGRVSNATASSPQANLLGNTFLGQGAWSAQNENIACVANGNVTAAQCFNAGMNFDRRQKQLLQWWSPNWNGVEARVSYAAVGFSDGVTADSRPAGSFKPTIWDFSLRYSNGPLSIGYAYERQKDLLAYAAATSAAAGGVGALAGGVGTGAWSLTNVATINGVVGASTINGSTGTGHRLGGKYSFDLGGGNSIGVGALWESLKWDVNYAVVSALAIGAGGGDLTQLKKTDWRLQANYVTGNHFFGFDYVRANELKGNIGSTVAARAFDGSGTSAKSWQLSYNYLLSKRTSITAYYLDVKNDTNAAYSGIVFAGIATAAGAEPKYYGVTLRHAF